jgi:hypothetical protein
MSTSLVEIARGISGERYRNKDRLKDSEIDNNTMVNALRKIHQSNVIMENINQTDKSMQLEYIHHEQDSKQLYIEMKDGLDKLKEKNFKIESECKDTLELNKKLLDINRSVEKE